jgi:hypothetical protein
MFWASMLAEPTASPTSPVEPSCPASHPSPA